MTVGVAPRGYDARGEGAANCAATAPITGTGVNVTALSFRDGLVDAAPAGTSWNAGDGYPPRVVISASVSPTDPALADITYTLQMTVSGRFILDN